MKFERLRLAGFKTFVDPTEIAIAPGLTGVVGPNGCGKSNLVEALRWVMGETSSKSLRGGGMEDVIFGGSTTRPERNHAEVSVRICAPEADLPLHLAGQDHIDIARKIVREQGSTYRMNGREVRARDVQILFADAASGARSPSLVRQGQIGEIINAKPQHRRRILEDAAGVAGLHARRHEAELRLKQAEENLTRAEDVLGQLDRQIGDLKKQARLAEKYKSLAAEIRALELRLFASGLEAARRDVATADRDADLSARDVAAAIVMQGEAERARGLAEHEAGLTRKAAAEAGAEAQAINAALATLDAEIRQVDTRLAELRQRLGELENDRVTATRMAEDAAQATASLDAEAAGLHQRLADLDEALSHQRQTREAKLAGRAAAETALAEFRAEQARDEAEYRAALRQSEDSAARAARLAHAVREAEATLRAAEAEASRDSTVTDLEKRVLESESALSQAIAAQDIAEPALVTARQEEQKTRPALAEAERLLQRLDTEARTIRKLVDNAEPGLWTPAIDRITVKPGYEVALAAGMGDDLDAAIEPGAGRNWSGPHCDGDQLPPLPDGVEVLLAHVEAPQALHARLSQIGVVDKTAGDRLQAVLHPGQRLVSREGDLWRWDGLRTKAESPSASARRLAERNRLGEIETQRDAARQKRDHARAALERAGNTLRRAVEAEAQARQSARQALQTRDAAQAALQRELVRTRDVRLRVEAASARLETLRQDATEAQHAAETARATLSALVLPTRQDDHLPALAAALTEARQAETAALQAEARLDSERSGATTRLAAVAAEITAWRERCDRSTEALAEHGSRHARLQDDLARTESLPETLALRRLSLRDAHETARAASLGADERAAQAETTLRLAERQAREAMEALSTTREAQARAGAKREHTLSRLNEMTRAIEDDIGGPIATLDSQLAALPPLDSSEPERIEARLHDLKAERTRLGAINLRADIELAEVDGTRTQLLSEREEIAGAIRKLRRAIDALNTEGRQRLRAAFDVVNGHFQRLFADLFGGGTAELKLVEAEDPLEAGLEILAKPPGKKPQLLSLLSGGEQALTATALIFAVFLTNPSPICVLDEVDAPLDDSNVERLCDLLRRMAGETETRFLVITHNPISMARMDRLYGVTMVERGVSRVVSVDLAQAERMAEAV